MKIKILSKYETSLVYFLALFFYMIFITKVISISHDSIGYIAALIEGDVWFHPHHLLFHKTAYAWYKLTLLIFPNISPSTAIASLNTFFGAGSLTVIYTILRRIYKCSAVYSGLFTTVVGLSSGFLFYSMCVEVYLIPLFFMLITIYLILKNNFNTKNIYLIAIFAALAVLYHQVHVLFGCGVFITLLIKKFKMQQISSKSLVRFAVTYISLIGIPYLLVVFYFLGFTKVTDITYWLTYYNHVDNYWNQFNSKFLIKPIIGFSRSLISPEVFFTIPEIRSLIQNMFSANNLADEVYLVRNLSSNLWLVLITLITFLFSYFIFIYNTVKCFLQNKKTFVSELLVIIIVLFIYICFFMNWEPRNPEFWIPQTTFIWLIIGISLKKYSNYRFFKICITALLSCFLFFNMYFLILPAQDKNNDFNIYHTNNLINELEPNTAIFLINKWIVGDYLKIHKQKVQYLIPTQISDGKKEFISELRHAIYKSNILINADTIIHHNNKTLFINKNIQVEIDIPIVSFKEKYYYNKKWYWLKKLTY